MVMGWSSRPIGQLVTSEILMASESGCPIEFHKIEIDACDEMFDKNCQGGRYMPFHRARYDHRTGQSPNNPREQMGITYMETIVVLKMGITYMETIVVLKMVVTYMETIVVLKMGITYMETIVVLKMGITYMETIVVLKMGVRYMETIVVLKMGITYMETIVVLKMRVTYMETIVVLKITYMETINVLKIGVTYMETIAVLKMRMGVTYMETIVVLKMGVTYMETIVVLKMGITYMETIVVQKMGVTYMETIVVLKMGLNLMTSWIDGSFVYSTSEAWVNAMRSFRNGSFRTEGTYPPRNKDRVPLFNSPPAQYLGMLSPERMFLLGDPRTNQNPALLAFGILFFRWHNTLAARFQAQHPDWSDEEIFQQARRWVIASLQNIILYEYLPVLLKEDVSPYAGYKPDVHPGVSHVFQSAAFRFGHTMIPPGLYRRDKKCNFRRTRSGYPAVRLCTTWWNAEEVLMEAGIEELLLGLASQISEREDAVLCSDVRDKLFGPMDFTRRDLAALNIMRGRDNGVADYNSVRRAYQLSPVTNWTELAGSESMGLTLSKQYTSINDVDVYVGGMLETDLDGRPGPLFRRVIREQFERLRDADRFWFENTENGLFTKAEVAEIRNITLWDVIVNSTDVPADAVQKQVFAWQEGDPCPQPFQLRGADLEPCMILGGFHYFQGNEVAFTFACIGLLFVPLCKFLTNTLTSTYIRIEI
ncbi:bli-3 [Cordylochernes scorpioides]|uniref:Bli-3 n=1 Tax=Cordylochernes scorpioides TaxID=51811 RepID=A0ABY6L235_9ARAC|nr:bli-3 [Cordylochernes scorpioides]